MKRKDLIKMLKRTTCLWTATAITLCGLNIPIWADTTTTQQQLGEYKYNTGGSLTQNRKFTTFNSRDSEDYKRAKEELEKYSEEFYSNVKNFSDTYIGKFGVSDADSNTQPHYMWSADKLKDILGSSSVDKKSVLWSDLYKQYNMFSMNGKTDNSLLGLHEKANGDSLSKIGFSLYDDKNSGKKMKVSDSSDINLGTEGVSIKDIKINALKTEFSALKAQAMAGIIYRLPDERVYGEDGKPTDKNIYDTRDDSTIFLKNFHDTMMRTDLANDDWSGENKSPVGVNAYMPNDDKRNLTKLINYLDLWQSNPGLSWNIYNSYKQIGKNRAIPYVNTEKYGIGDLYSLILGEYPLSNDNTGFIYNKMRKSDDKIFWFSLVHGDKNTYGASNLGKDGVTFNYLNNTPVQSIASSGIVGYGYSEQLYRATGYTPISIFANIGEAEYEEGLKQNLSWVESENMIKSISFDYKLLYDNPTDYKGHKSNELSLGGRRAFISGIDTEKDGIDILDNYFNTLLSIVDYNTFKLIMKNRFSAEVNESTQGSGITDELALWVYSEQDVYKTALETLTEVDNFYQKFGKTKFTTELKNSVTDSVNKINELLSSAGLPTINTSNFNKKQDISSISSIDENSPVRQFIKEVDGNLTTTDEYNKLLAWTSSFIPFETNLYDIGDNITSLPVEVREVYKKYAKYRQPLSVVSDNNNVYTDLLKGSVKKLDYITLNNFIDRVDTGDIFLYVNTVSQEDIKKNGVMDVVVTENSEKKSVNTESNSNSSNSNTSATNNTNNNEAQGSTETVTNVNISQPTIDGNQLTSNVRFFGPVYASSFNDEYINIYTKFKSMVGEDDKVRDNIVYGDKVLNSTQSSKIRSYGLYNEDITAVRGETEEDTKTSKGLMTGEKVSSYLVQRIMPECMYMNQMLMHNTIQDKEYNQSDIRKDMDKLLYMDFIGNIVTESGYIVVPAIANATRTNNIQQYLLFNAQFINSYPNIHYNEKEGVFLDKNDKDKKVLYLLWYLGEGFNYNRDTSRFFGDSFDGNTSTYTWCIGKPKNGGKSYDDSLSVNKPRMVSFLESSGNDDYGLRGDEYNKSIYDFPDNSYAVNMFSGRNMDKVDKKFLNIIATSTKYAFDYKSNVPSVTIKTPNGTGKAELINIPPSTSSYEAMTLYYLNYNALDNNQKKNNTTYYNVDTTIGILTALMAGSTDTSVLDSSISDSKSKFKNDATTNMIGQFAEGAYNQYVRKCEYNQTIFVPTFDKFESIKYLSIYVIPVMLIILTLIILILLVMLVTIRSNDSVLSAKDLTLSLFSTFLLITYILLGLEPSIRLVFQTPANYIMENNNIMMLGYELENGFKDEDNNYFTGNINKAYSSYATLLLDNIKTPDALEWRKTQGRPEVETGLYYPTFDSSKQYLAGNIYLQNKQIKMGALNLLNSNGIVSDFGNNECVVYEQIRKDDIDSVTYYLPYYHFTESIIYTLNQYSGATSNTYKVINYNTGATKLTGRADNYFNSLFFIAPDDILPAIEKLQQDYRENDYTLSDIFRENGQPNQEEVEEVILENGESYLLDKKTLSAYLYLEEEMGGDLRDWLGIRKMHYKADNNAPFKNKFIDDTMNCRWYPNLDDISEQEYLQKVYAVNENVKQFVLHNIEPISTTMSDETIIKLISLKASMEYNKVFSSLCDKKLYPRLIDGSKANNDFLVKSVIIPRNELFMGDTSSLMYYIVKNSDCFVLFLESMAIFIRIIIYWTKMPAIIVCLMSAIGVYLCFLFKKENIQKILTKLFSLSVFYLLIQYMDLVFFIINQWATKYIDISGLVAIHLTTSCISGFVRVVVIKMSIDVIRDFIVTLGTPLSLFSKEYQNSVKSEDYSQDYKEFAHIGDYEDNVGPSSLSNKNYSYSDQDEIWENEDIGNEPKSMYNSSISKNVIDKEIVNKKDKIKSENIQEDFMGEDYFDTNFNLVKTDNKKDKNVAKNKPITLKDLEQDDL